MLAERVFGFGIFGFRFVTGLLQIALLYVTGLHRRFVGNIAIWAALIIALSPAFVFYSRYAIHESLFVLSEISFSYGFFLYRQEKSTKSLWWMSLALVGLITTKETFIIFIGTWAIAVVGLKFFEALFPRFRSAPDEGFERPAPALQNWIAVSLVAIVAILAFFTGFFLYLHGAVDMVTALSSWTKTGTTHSGHEKPFMYWIDLLRRFEWPCFIGLCLTPVLFFFSSRTLRTLLLVGFGLWLSASLIPYKTPWLILSYLWLLAFAAGAVINRILPALSLWRGVRTGLAVACFASIFFSAREMWRISFRDFAKQGEPYVYVQSTNDFKTAVDVVMNHIKAFPEDVTLRVLSLNRDPWPLPYLLQPLTNILWGHADAATFDGADVVFSDIEDETLVQSKLHGTYFSLPFQIRESYQQGRAYLKTEKFKGEVPTGTVVFAGQAAP